MNVKIIEDINIDELKPYVECNESQLLHYYEPDLGVFIAETPMVIERAIERGCEPISFLVEEGAYESTIVKNLLLKCDEVDVFVAPLNVINKITGFNLTRGVLALMRRQKLPSIQEICNKASRVAILEDVMNPTNVGAIFRSAAALGVDSIILTHGSADPYYRRAARVSMGTVFQIPWTYFEKNADIIDAMHNEQFQVCSMALVEDAMSVLDQTFKDIDKLAIVMGTEATGIKQETINRSDYKAIIPMHLGVDSLNVAAASAVAFWELTKRRG